MSLGLVAKERGSVADSEFLLFGGDLLGTIKFLRPATSRDQEPHQDLTRSPAATKTLTRDSPGPWSPERTVPSKDQDPHQDLANDQIVCNLGPGNLIVRWKSVPNNKELTIRD